MFSWSVDHRHLHSFPTRRSSDLSLRRVAQLRYLRPDLEIVPLRGNVPTRVQKVKAGRDGLDAALLARAGLRSEEHTSELQSPYDLVCRLLLEKKKERICRAHEAA